MVLHRNTKHAAAPAPIARSGETALS
jgi:hypothetical protein